MPVGGKRRHADEFGQVGIGRHRAALTAGLGLGTAHAEESWLDTIKGALGFTKRDVETTYERLKKSLNDAMAGELSR